jgi:hypothetical protein
MPKPWWTQYLEYEPCLCVLSTPLSDISREFHIRVRAEWLYRIFAMKWIREILLDVKCGVVWCGVVWYFLSALYSASGIMMMLFMCSIDSKRYNMYVSIVCPYVRTQLITFLCGTCTNNSPYSYLPLLFFSS